MSDHLSDIVFQEVIAERDALRQELAEAEVRVTELNAAIIEYLSSETAGGDPIGPQWYIDCNERTKGKNYPGKARLARAALAEDTP